MIHGTGDCPDQGSESWNWELRTLPSWSWPFLGEPQASLRVETPSTSFRGVQQMRQKIKAMSHTSEEQHRGREVHDTFLCLAPPQHLPAMRSDSQLYESSFYHGN